MTENRDWQFFKYKILWNLASSRKWGRAYSRVENVSSGLPGDQIGSCRGVIEDLLKEGLLILHKKGECVSLNHRRKGEILTFLESFNK